MKVKYRAKSNEEKQAEIKVLLDDAQKKIEDYFDDAKSIKEYLDFTSKFYKYSANNCNLIESQFSGASAVASYNKWKELGFKVNLGEKAIKILVPSKPIEKFKNEKGEIKPVKKATQEEKLKIKKGIYKISKSEVFFVKGNVFDISQTDAKVEDLPKIFPNRWLEGDVKNYKLIIKSLEKISRSINIKIINPKSELGAAKGVSYTNTREIALNPRNSELQNIKTLVHELTHAKLHTTETFQKYKKYEKEFQAELTAYTVCRYIGIDTSEYSIKYLDSWTKGKTFEDKKQLLKEVHDTAKEFITIIEETLINEKENNITKREEIEIVEKENKKQYKVLRVDKEMFDEFEKMSKERYGGTIDAKTIMMNELNSVVEENFREKEVINKEDSIIKKAEELINNMEKTKTLFGKDERNLITNYAYNIGDMEKVENLAEKLAEEGYQVTNGYIDPDMRLMVENEISSFTKKEKTLAEDKETLEVLNKITNLDDKKTLSDLLSVFDEMEERINKVKDELNITKEQLVEIQDLKDNKKTQKSLNDLIKSLDLEVEKTREKLKNIKKSIKNKFKEVLKDLEGNKDITLKKITDKLNIHNFLNSIKTNMVQLGEKSQNTMKKIDIVMVEMNEIKSHTKSIGSTIIGKESPKGIKKNTDLSETLKKPLKSFENIIKVTINKIDNSIDKVEKIEDKANNFKKDKEIKNNEKTSNIGFKTISEEKEIEIKQMIKSHEKWLKSNGLSGEKLVLNNENLNGFKFYECDLSFAEIKNCNLTNCVFYADMSNVDFSDNKISKTKWIGSNVADMKTDKITKSSILQTLENSKAHDILSDELKNKKQTNKKEHTR